MSEQCVHTFTPNHPEFRDYEYKGNDGGERRRWLLGNNVPGVEEGTWSCAHDVVPGYSKCPFHLPPSEQPSDLDVTAEFLHQIEQAQTLDTQTARRRRVQFIDATFESFDLAGEEIDTGSGHFINLSHTTISDLNLTDARVRQPIRFPHATFEGFSRFGDATFGGTVDIRNATFLGPARFRGATFNRPFTASHATFVDDAYFWYTIFRRHAVFRDVDFQKLAYFRGVDFDNYVRFSQAHFHDEARFKLGEFGDDADFIDTQFDGPHSFIDAEFDRTTNFSGVQAAGPMDLSGATVETLQMIPDERGSDTQYVDLSESVVKEGQFGQPRDGAILYDAERATLGDVAVTTPGDESVIDHIRLIATNFDGFEFESDDMDPEAEGWRIHTVFDE